ncbi:MAG: hypothetical protein KDI90_02340 [Alphaproteobacteria bacterium]|nr:hypothetical protein [Alphaproteobacteria bacterium]MCB9975173.1 hypothetical protein [Rhodospirillales bacterium]
MSKPVKFNNTFRDSYQSNLAMQPSAKEIVGAETHLLDVGWHSAQGGGGTFFHVPILRGRDPWEEQRIVRNAYPDIPMSILVRGDTLVGYDINPDDVIEAYIRQMATEGINGFTIFDGLNDTRNQEVPIRVVNECREAGADVYAQGVICLGDSPAFTMDLYMDSADKLVGMGVRDLYLKDPCGVVKPETVYELVSRLKGKYPHDVYLHAHNTHGLAYVAYMAGIEAGADAVDVAHPGMGENVAQPSALRMLELIENHPNRAVRDRAPKLDIEAIEADMESLAALRLRYRNTEPVFDRGVYDALYKAKGPGGAASTLKPIMEANMKAVLGLDWRRAQIEIYRRQSQILGPLGYPLQVTPHAKNTTEQAGRELFMAKQGKEPLTELTPPIIKYLTGQLGRVPGNPDPELVQRALDKAGLSEPVTERAASRLAPRMDKARQLLADNGVTDIKDEDVLTVAMWMDEKQTGLTHVLKRERGELESVAEPELPSFLRDPTSGNGERHMKNGQPVRWQFEIAGAVGGAGMLEIVAQEALELEKYGHYKTGDMDAVVGEDRADALYYETMYQKWRDEARVRLENFAEAVPAMLYDDGFRSGQLYQAVTIVNDMLADVCKKKGVSQGHIPVVSHSMIGAFLDQVRSGDYIGVAEPDGVGEFQPQLT